MKVQKRYTKWNWRSKFFVSYMTLLFVLFLINKVVCALVIIPITSLATVLSIAFIMVQFQDGASKVSDDFKAKTAFVFEFCALQWLMSVILWVAFQIRQ